MILQDLFTKRSNSRLFLAFFEEGPPREFYFRDFISGALLESLVDEVARRAWKRLLLNKVPHDSPSFGIVSNDISGIVTDVVRGLIPRDENFLSQWLSVNGYSRVSAFRFGTDE